MDSANEALVHNLEIGTTAFTNNLDPDPWVFEDLLNPDPNAYSRLNPDLYTWIRNPWLLPEEEASQRVLNTPAHLHQVPEDLTPTVLLHTPASNILA